jgi:hypothetical protein
MSLGEVWLPVGTPGFAGADKARWRAVLDARYGPDGWRLSHVVRGRVVPPGAAILEYEASYRAFLRDRRPLVAWLTETFGNVYDSGVSNVLDDDYYQPATVANHYQDIAVRRVMAELVDDPDWPEVTATAPGEVELLDRRRGLLHRVPRAAGFRGSELLEIRDPQSNGFVLSPAVVPVHDPTLIATLPDRREWYHQEGCAHLSVEAFWQMSKVIEVRYDRFLALGEGRVEPLAGL